MDFPTLYQNVCDISFTFTFSIFEFKKASLSQDGFSVFTTMSLNWKPDRSYSLSFLEASINLSHSRCKSRKVIPVPYDFGISVFPFKSKNCFHEVTLNIALQKPLTLSTVIFS